jgi:hypothetical protein
VPGRREEVALREWVSLVWYEIVGSDDLAHLQAGTKVERVRSARGVMAYAAKYIAKAEDKAPPAGRWWGVFNSAGLPWGRAVGFKLGFGEAAQLRRAARSYVNRQRRNGRKWRPRGSCAWFCTASGWLPLAFAPSPQSKRWRDIPRPEARGPACFLDKVCRPPHVPHEAGTNRGAIPSLSAHRSSTRESFWAVQQLAQGQ